MFIFRFKFKVTNEDLEPDGKVATVIQFFQYRTHRKDENLEYIRADLYKVRYALVNFTVKQVIIFIRADLYQSTGTSALAGQLYSKKNK